ncbi:MAG TPA: grasp-with-spasm system SPASM domain peptide maturase, partial [Chitinophagaceae bacterium]|nr:grasp-with-spasm system SPASM domain peptide maturase [Chitinophagaceae bacterium]
MRSYFRLYANCILVKGYCRSLIYDLQFSEVFEIPNILYDILKESNSFTIKDLKKKYPDYSKGIGAYFKLLQDNNMGFYTDQINTYPELNLEWDYPSKITNSIIEISNVTIKKFNQIIHELDSLNCEALELISYRYLSLRKLQTILNLTLDTKIKSIYIITKYYTSINQDNYIKLTKDHPRICSILFHSSINYNLTQDKIIFMANKIPNNTLCGKISQANFSINIKHFTEAQKHNSCLNHKISIDVNGNIKNCPSMQKSYGNINDTTLTQALNKKGFKDNWYITKDQIEVCKDCEFRYMCTDCRAYLDEPKNKFSKPLKCGYNPYTTEWQDWSTNP